MQHVINFTRVGMDDVNRVGGKNASLGEMIQHLSRAGIQVPPGFATTAAAYLDFLQQNNLDQKIYEALSALNVDDVVQLKKTSQRIRGWINRATLPDDFAVAIQKAYRQLKLKKQQSVAVRSSATAEDLPTASFAGQQETYLNVVGEKELLVAVKRVFASLFTARAIAYRVHQGFAHERVAISAGVQLMIRSDKAASGVVFTLDTESGFDQVVFITAAYGLGESVVQGLVNPDECYVHKPTLQKGKAAIVSRTLGSKAKKFIYRHPQQGIRSVAVPKVEQQQFCLTDDELLHLARQAVLIEKHYGKPMDIEWAKDGIDNQLYIIQARPETVKAGAAQQVIERYRLVEKAKPMVSGRSIGQKIGQGSVRLITDPKHMAVFKQGEVLVTDMTDPDWEPIMKRAAAIVTNRGGRTCHAAIVARELGIPAVVGCGNATAVLKNNAPVTVSCASGETGYVYRGLLKYHVEQTTVAHMPKLNVKLCLNLANPEKAFSYQFLPNHGVGLARLEFIIGNMIGIHPNAILQIEGLSKKLRTQILQRTAAYASPREFYCEKLAEGVATIAAAFYPKPVIVRFSDFKTNEYANLLGGAPFEPKEENPMLGFRGASRYNAAQFRECFALECDAIKRVREQKGLTNTHVMFPFVRTVAELTQLIGLLKSYGLKRSKTGLQLYMMCEIPSNAILADEFLQHVDGFSIGSNDLTQLTLGLDRDSALIADLFDERNAAIKVLLEQVIQACNKAHKYVGICGQAPSDYLDFAQWLMAQGIASMSLSADSIVPTWLALGARPTL